MSYSIFLLKLWRASSFKEREGRGRERGGERERQTDRQTDRDRETETDRDRQRQAGRQTDRVKKIKSQNNITNICISINRRWR